ncbi:MAG: PAS domain S-box protein [Methanomicrobiaceae archaeon]|nr:PAS domain S-box protein [Methanomicrobiaceae archaeon]
MKINTKVGVIIIIALIGLILTFYWASATVVLAGFADVERDQAVGQAEALAGALDRKILAIDTAAAEWASRDETETLLERTVLGHLAPPVRWELLDPGVFSRLDIHYLLVEDSQGNIIASGGYDPATGQEIAIPAGLLAHVKGERPLVDFEDGSAPHYGVLSVSGEGILVAARPVFEDGSSHTIGHVVAARNLDVALLEQLSPGAGSTLMVTDTPPPVPVVTGERTITAYTLIRDVYGEPAFALGLEVPREIYVEGRERTLFLLLYMLGGVLVFSLIIILLLEQGVISRLRSLNTRVNAIGANRDFSARLTVSGRDEITDLSTSINWMLADLEESQLNLQDQLSETEERYRLFFNTGTDPVLIFRIGRDGTFGRFIETNVAACRLLGYSRGELLAMTPADVIAPGDAGALGEQLKEILEKEHALFETDLVGKNGWVTPVEVNAHFFAHMGWTAVLMMARDITERQEIERLKRDAFRQIEKNMEQFAILNDHIRNPLQAMVGLSLLNASDDEVTEKILAQAEVINRIVDQLDQGWIESEKIRDWLRKYYDFQ